MTPAHIPQEVWDHELAVSTRPAAEWLWQGFVAPGNPTLLTSPWKAGKTTLLSLLLARRKTGGAPAGLAGRIAAAAAALALGTGACYLLERAAGWPWQRRKAFREDRRQALLHLVLLTGAAVFSLPARACCSIRFRRRSRGPPRPCSPAPACWRRSSARRQGAI